MADAVKRIRGARHSSKLINDGSMGCLEDAPAKQTSSILESQIATLDAVAQPSSSSTDDALLIKPKAIGKKTNASARSKTIENLFAKKHKV